MTLPEGFVPDAPEGFEPDTTPAAAPAESTPAKVVRIAREELAATPARMWEGVKNAASTAIETVRNPSMRTVLPLTLGPGSGAVSRLAALAAGAVADQPSSDPMQNVRTGATAIFGSPSNPLSMILSPAVMEAVTGGAGKVFRSTAPGARAVNAADAQRVGQAIDEVAPTLKPGATAQEMQRTAEGPGLARIGEGKEAAVQEIERRMENTPAQSATYIPPGEMPMPSLATSTVVGRTSPSPGGMVTRRGVYGEPTGTVEVPPAAGVPVTVGRGTMSLREANDALSEIGDMLRGAKPLDPRYANVDLKQLYGQIANEIRGGIQQVAGPEAAQIWDTAQRNYRAGRNVLDLLTRPNLFRQGQFTLAELQRVLKDPEARAELARGLGGNLATGENLGAYNRLVGAITRGAEPGMVDELAGKAPGFFSGRGSYGFWRLPIEGLRRVLPNASTRYVGQVPYTVPTSVRTLLDVEAARAQ